jgi:hypothetical protein
MSRQASEVQITTLVSAFHWWFDAQLSDHGKHAMYGHAHHEGMMKQ